MASSYAHPGIEVSIPFRYAENFVHVDASLFFKLAFQFLLGTLKTALLIYLLEYSVTFQFLLGTLKTALIPSPTSSVTDVSIPFRYAENYVHVFLKDVLWAVSIPFRYAENV